MKFNKVPDNVEEEMYFLHYSENNVWEIGVHTVMFGYRIRVGLIGDDFYALDYCAGNQQENVEKVFSMVKAIMEKVTERNFYTIKWPVQERKPIIGTECEEVLESLAGEYELLDLPLL